MLVFKCFIIGLLLWLSTGHHQEFNTTLSDHETQLDTVISPIHKNHQALIVEVDFNLNQANWWFKTLKTPFALLNNRALLYNACIYNHRLLYLNIGDTIPLQLTTSKLVFPFHCFT